MRAWAAQPPGWLDVRTVSSGIDDPAWRALDIGEREALALARTLGADLVLMDDRAGVAVTGNWAWRRRALWVCWTWARGVG